MTTTDAAASRESTDAAVEAALRTVARNVPTFATKYPADTTRGGVYPFRPETATLPEGSNYGWTTSFWPGQLWLAAELTGEESYHDAALAHVTSFTTRVRDRIDLETHDLGFLYTLACVTAWRLDGDVAARDGALAAADALMLRFLEPAGIIQAWGDLGDPRQRGRTIIDSLMNMPLLRWATLETGDERYAEAAQRHTVQLRDTIVRPDGSTFHTFYWDTVTGAPVRGGTEQGESDVSCWARGQAWGIFGFALAYRETGDASFLDAALRCADYYLDHLPSDGVPFWDLSLVGVERDSSAAAIAACGLDELVRVLPDVGPGRERYANQTRLAVDTLVAGYTPGAGSDSNALLLHGVYDKPKEVGVDEASLWGDYYFLEALTRRTVPDWVSYWWVR
jgi:unsaturated chondroitin disaccharide hydrolase